MPLRTLASAAFAWLLVTSCRDGTGPDAPLAGSIAIVPVFESSAAALVPVERLRVVLLREDSVTVAKDTVFDLVAGQDSVDLAINVTLLSSSERFFLEMQLINAAQDTVFRGGPTIVTASTSAGTASVVEILLVYTGTGSDAATVRITTTTERAFFGETVGLAAEALDATGNPIPGTPIKWSSVNPAAGSFPDDESGAFVAGMVRGPALVAATLLTGPTDTAAVMVQPPPSAIAITTGDDQTGGIGAALPQPLVVTVTAADNQGVEGVEVVFSVAAGNGSLSATSVFTDAQGMAQVIWTLGSVPGTMQATATVPAAGDASVMFVATAQAVAFRWLNTGGGNWSDPTNWDLGAVPGSGSTVVIDVDGIYTVNLDVVADVDVLTLGAAMGTQTLAIAANSLTLNMASTVGANGVIDMSGGTLNGTGTLSVSGSFNWTGGTIDGTGRLIIEPDATLMIGGGAKTLSGGRVLDNFGTATWVAGDIDAAGGSAIFNGITGTFDVQADVQFTQGTGGASLFDNNGSFTRTVGTGAVTFTTRFDNLTTVDVQTGTLQLNAGGTGGASGTFTVASGAALGLGGGTHTASAIMLAATGTLNVTAGTVELTGISTLSGTVAVATPGTLKFNGSSFALDATSAVSGDGIVEFAAGTVTVNGTYAVTGTSMHITGGTVNFENTGTPATTTGLTMSAGTLGGAGQFRVSTTLDWTGGTMTGIGETWLEATGSATLGGGSKTLDGRAFTNGGGAVVWTLGDILSGNGSVITNAAGGTIDIQGDVALQFTLGGAIPSIVNSGGLVRSVGTGVVSLGADVNNTGAGTIDVQTGTIALIGAATYTQGLSAVLMGAGTFDVPGDVITGGTINMAGGTLKVGGVLNPTGTFTVGTVVFTGTGPQLVPLALSPYNNVQVTGAAVEPDGSMTFNGTFIVSGTGVFDLTPLSIATVTVTGDVSIIDNGMINVGGLGRILQANSNMVVANNADLYVGLGGGVNVVGDFSTQDLAMVRMTGPGDELNVTGDVTFGGGSNALMLTGGTVRVGGNFTQSGDPQSFAPGALLNVIFTNVCTPKTITFADPVNSYFPSVDLNGSSIELASDVAIRGGLFGGGDITQIGGPRQLTVTGNSFVTAGCNSTINLETLRVEGDFAINSAVTLTTLEVGDILSLVTGSYSATNTVFLGIDGPQEIPLSLSYQNVDVTGDVEFEYFSTQTISGNLVISGSGVLNFNDTDVAVGGDFTTQDNGLIILASFYDELTVTGSIVFGGGNTGPGSPLCPVLGCLADGTIYASGDFTQLGTNSSESFHAGDFNTVYFDGTGAQTLSFTNTGSGSGTSHFANIAFANTIGVTLGSDIYAHCDLISFAGPPAVVIGNGNTLTVGGLGASDLQLQRVLLVYDGIPDAHSTGIFSRFDNVSFVNYDPGDTQFTIIDPGGVSPYTLNNIIFGTTPTTGFYMDVTDSAADANTLTIQMANPTPGTPATFVLTSGGAVVIWP